MPRKNVISRFVRFSPILFGLLCAGAVRAQIDGQFFPTEALPKNIALGPDGALWFTQEAPKLGRIDANGFITEFPLSTPASTITSGADGNLWFTLPGRIGRMTTAGTVTEFALPNPSAMPYVMTSGTDGNLWFTDPVGNEVGRITTSGVVTMFPTTGRGLGGITSGPDGSLWFAEADSNRIGRITTAGTLREFALPGGSSDRRYPYRYPADIVAGPDGNLWFTNINVGLISRMTPGGTVTDFPTRGDSWAITAAADGNLWAAGTGTLTRITTSGSVTDFIAPIEGSYYLTSGPYQGEPAFFLSMASTSDGALWVSDPGSRRIGRFSAATSGTPQCVAGGPYLCLDNGRFRVQADWNAGDGTTGHGHAVALTSSSGYFWFFDAANVEMVVKVLDGCEANQHEWVFAAGLTNVEVSTTVTDTVTGLSRTYTNSQGTPFVPVQDTAAFATCP